MHFFVVGRTFCFQKMESESSGGFKFNFFGNDSSDDNNEKDAHVLDGLEPENVPCGEVTVDGSPTVSVGRVSSYQGVKYFSAPSPKEAGLDIEDDKDVVTNIYEGEFIA